ncbi:MAG TPA: hypothetical protein VMS17_13275 [Gemmataceae bacterium]|nr:hypothetical protein [Gemmataceae bacterium]
MLVRSLRPWPLFLILGAGMAVLPALRAQDPAPDDAAAQPPPVPKGVEVLARGPVHEAFATLTAEPQPTKPVAKKPPKALQEMPPEDKPEGDAIWISGYWAWDDDRNDFLWVSGIWRTPPPGKQWVAGYWRDEMGGDVAQWVPGFWTPVAAAAESTAQDVIYYPKPPDPPAIAPPGNPPAPDTFYVPGHWEWNGADYAWRSGFWARVQPNYVWIPAHYRWSPAGYIYVAGYWDYSVKRRGVLYAPVVIDPNVVDATYVYTPAYAVDDTVVVDALFVRPCTCHYYFGDYYDVTYRDYGYTSCVVYSQSNYDSIIVYERYQHRDDPTWINVQINLSNDRAAGLAPVPPRTLNQQVNIVNNTTIVNNNISNTNVNVNNINNVNNNVTVNKQVSKTTVLASPAKVMAANGVKLVKLDVAARQQVKQQATAIQQVSVQRTHSEVAAPGGPPKQPHVASLNVPKAAAGPATQPAATQNAKPTTAAPPAVNTRPTTSTVPPTTPTVTPTATPTPPVSRPNPTTTTPPPAMTPTTPTRPTTTTPTPGTTPTKPPPPAQQPPPKRPPPPPPPSKDKDKDKDKQ